MSAWPENHGRHYQVSLANCTFCQSRNLNNQIDRVLDLSRDTHFVQRNNKRRLAITEQTQRLQGLGFEAVHDINNKDCDVAQGAATRTQIRERLVSGGIDNQ